MNIFSNSIEGKLIRKAMLSHYIYPIEKRPTHYVLNRVSRIFIHVWFQQKKQRSSAVMNTQKD